MEYSNDFTQIRMGLTNFIGALLKSSHYTGDSGRNEVVGAILEEVLGLCKDSDNTYNMMAVKPIFKAIVHICNQRIRLLEELPGGIASEQIASYNLIVTEINGITEK